ncbi:MAG: 4-hydroxy-tetrahydrodipicolinate reductase [Bacteroidota bacterium]
MKIALIGYGKMGRTIEKMAIEQGHEVVLKFDVDNFEEFTVENVKKVDVAIEFTRPEGAADNLRKCIEARVPVVCGTTGWLDRRAEIEAFCLEKESAFFYASNYSVGVNMFFALNKFLAKMMNEQPQYILETEEIHHTQKLDAPSGTSITLAEGIIENIQVKTAWINEASDATNEVPIISKRIEKVPGTHSIHYKSVIDDIEIKHTAHSRAGFAGGAIQAAEWLIGKKGVFGMPDMLGF